MTVMNENNYTAENVAADLKELLGLELDPQFITVNQASTCDDTNFVDARFEQQIPVAEAEAKCAEVQKLNDVPEAILQQFVNIEIFNGDREDQPEGTTQEVVEVTYFKGADAPEMANLFSVFNSDPLEALLLKAYIDALSV